MCSHVKGAAFGGIEHQESAKDPLTVCGHIEGHAVLSPQHALPQLLLATSITCYTYSTFPKPCRNSNMSHYFILGLLSLFDSDSRDRDRKCGESDSEMTCHKNPQSESDCDCCSYLVCIFTTGLPDAPTSYAFNAIFETNKPNKRKSYFCIGHYDSDSTMHHNSANNVPQKRNFPTHNQHFGLC